MIEEIKQESVQAGIKLVINDLVGVCHDLAKESGWWTDTETGLPLLEAAGRWAPHVIGGKIALIHSEASEALEGQRKNVPDDHLPHRSMLEVELADLMIRALDLAGAMDLDLGGAVAEKLLYNQSRADHKPENRALEGGKKF
jgi:NTP pyrophosphatase (non-canonical NTP hydrolase)